MTKVKQLDIVGGELELEELAILLSIRQTADAIKFPENDLAIPEQGPNVAPVRREARLIEVASVLGKERALFADGRGSCGRPKHTGIVGKGQKKAGSGEDCRAFYFELVMQAALNRFNKFAVQGVDLQLLLLFQY